MSESQLNIRSAILAAVQEEARPRWISVLVGICVFIVMGFGLYFGLGFFWNENPISLLPLCVLWSGVFSLGTYFWLRPNVRIQIKGHWSGYVSAKVLVVSVFAMLLQLFLCPHFAFLDHQLPGVSLFSYLTDFYMSLGGMKLCMLLCGVSFSSIASVGSLLWIRKTLSLRNGRTLVFSSLMVLLVILPVIFLQIEASSHHGQGWTSSVFWILGCILGVVGASILISVFSSKKFNPLPIPSDLRDFEYLYLEQKLSPSTNKLAPIFFEQADTHVYSDWLLPGAIRTGWDYGDDFYLAGFPDLSELFTRENGGFDFDFEVLRQYRRQGLTRFGKILRQKLKDKYFLDLASGAVDVSIVPRVVAQELGASFYVGVDLGIASSISRSLEFGEKFRSIFVGADVREFIQKLKPSSQVCIHISGLELKNSDTADSKIEIQNMMRSMKSVMLPGALLLLGAASHDFQPSPDDFKFIGQDRYHRLFVRR